MLIITIVIVVVVTTTTAFTTITATTTTTTTTTATTTATTSTTTISSARGVNRITYWSQGVASLPHKCQPPLPSARQYPSYGDCLEVKTRGNVIRTAPCWVLWHNVHSQQHTYMSSSYRSSRLGLSHWDPYAMHRGGCLVVLL